MGSFATEEKAENDGDIRQEGKRPGEVGRPPAAGPERHRRWLADPSLRQYSQDRPRRLATRDWGTRRRAPGADMARISRYWCRGSSQRSPLRDLLEQV